MSTVEKARKLAIHAHEGQKDRIGTDYFTSHVEVVANYTREYGGSIDQVVAAYLHDTIEDTDMSFDHLRIEFGEDIVELVDALSRRDGETYPDFINRLIQTPDAVLVKIADIRSNTDPLRVMYMSHADRVRLSKKYSEVLPVLWEAFGR